MAESEHPAATRGARRTHGRADMIDAHVGNRVRIRRTLLGLSQQRLGELVGLTFQQVQKYERGANRIGASRLYQLSRVLEVPISFFYDEMPGRVADAAAGLMPERLADATKISHTDPLVKRETLELVRAYYNISDIAVRERLRELIYVIARVGDTESQKPLDDKAPARASIRTRGE